VLQKLGDRIANALEAADAADQRAAESTDPGVRAVNEQIARSWRMLAHSYQFAEALDLFMIRPRPRSD
jgi:hypothetical protein